MKTLFSNYLVLITALLLWNSIYPIQPAWQLSKQDLELEENLLRIAQQKIENPYDQYVQVFIWLRQLKGSSSPHSNSHHLKPATKLAQQTAWNILFPTPSYMTQSCFLGNHEIAYKIHANRFLQFFWPGRLILLAWYPLNMQALEISFCMTEKELLQAAAWYGYLTQELQLQYGAQCPTKKIYRALQTLLQQGVTHIHQRDALSLLHLLLQDDPQTYQNFLENEEKVLQQTQDHYLEAPHTEQKHLLSTILALTRPLNSLRDFFESWGCCPV